MIRSEAEYERLTREQEQITEAIDLQVGSWRVEGKSDEQIARLRQPLDRYLEWVMAEVAEYNRFLSGDLPVVRRLSEIGRLLIAARIAARITQKSLAERLGVSKAMVSRDELNEYHGVRVDRAERILRELGVNLEVIPGPGRMLPLDNDLLKPLDAAALVTGTSREKLANQELRAKFALEYGTHARVLEQTQSGFTLTVPHDSDAVQVV
jgi:transcriptional regulator with XRE-family HTH domain